MKLKDCPFCGGKAKHTSFAELERIECEWCSLIMEDDVSYFAMISKWNTRANPKYIKSILPPIDVNVLDEGFTYLSKL